MPVAFVQEFKIVDGDHSTRNYDAVAARVDLETAAPDGLIAHTAGFDDDAGVFRVFDIWETREQGERFLTERLQPILADLLPAAENGAPPDHQAWYELHDSMTR